MGMSMYLTGNPLPFLVLELPKFSWNFTFFIEFVIYILILYQF
jgi:hypothetical protein